MPPCPPAKSTPSQVYLCSQRPSLCSTTSPQTRSHRSHKHFKEILSNNPSVQRRARLVDPSAHFSFVTPLHAPFPYRIQPPEDPQQLVVDKSSFIERWLSDREPLEPRPRDSSSAPPLVPYSSEERDAFPARELLGISPTGLRDCLPHLNVGDAVNVIGIPALSLSPQTGSSIIQPTDEDVSARTELVDVLGGHTVLMRHPEEGSSTQPFLPWSLRYSGHQFGVWAGQLGDGRAISICMNCLATAIQCVYKPSGNLPGERRSCIERGDPTQRCRENALFQKRRWPGGPSVIHP